MIRYPRQDLVPTTGFAIHDRIQYSPQQSVSAPGSVPTTLFGIGDRIRYIIPALQDSIRYTQHQSVPGTGFGSKGPPSQKNVHISDRSSTDLTDHLQIQQIIYISQTIYRSNRSSTDLADNLLYDADSIFFVTRLCESAASHADLIRQKHVRARRVSQEIQTTTQKKTRTFMGRATTLTGQVG